MTVLEFAKTRLFGEEQNMNMLQARLSMVKSGNEHASKEYLNDRIDESYMNIAYWKAYIDGAKAQKHEDDDCYVVMD